MNICRAVWLECKQKILETKIQQLNHSYQVSFIQKLKINRYKLNMNSWLAYTKFNGFEYNVAIEHVAVQAFKLILIFLDAQVVFSIL